MYYIFLHGNNKFNRTVNIFIQFELLKKKLVEILLPSHYFKNLSLITKHLEQKYSVINVETVNTFFYATHIKHK